MQRLAGLVLGLATAWLLIAADVLLGGPISDADVWLADHVHAPRRSPLELALLFWTHMHSHVAILLYSTVFALLLARRRAWEWVLAVAVAVPGAMFLNYSLKLAVQRSGPVLDNPALALETYSFPSGHTAASVAFYGMLAAYLGFRFPKYRGVFVGAAGAGVALVSFSRMALGALYFGDVLAALVSTGAWLLLCVGTVHARLAACSPPA